MQIPRNKFTCKYQGRLQMGQKVTIRFRWEYALPSASRNYLTTFCRHFVHYACWRLCSAIVHYIPVVFNVGEIGPQRAILCVVGRFCVLRDLGGDFSFRGAIFAGWNVLKFWIYSTRNNICCIAIKAFDALSTPWFITKVMEHIWQAT